jgi:hypothetical protein
MNLANEQSSDFEMSLEEQFIIKCLRSEYKAEGYDEFSNFNFDKIDWNLIYEKSIEWKITSFLYHIISKRFPNSQRSLIPHQISQKFKMSYTLTGLLNNSNYTELEKIQKTFTEEGIELILLKGSHLAKFVYRDIGLRAMSDIDLMVKKDEFLKALELLFQMGFGAPSEEKIELIERCKANFNKISPNLRHFPSLVDQKNKVKLDLHFSPVRLTAPFNIDIEGLWERSKKAAINGTKSLLLSPEDLLLHISIHNSYNHKFKFYGIKAICDTAQTLNCYGTEIDWDRLKHRAYDWGAKKSLYLTLRLTQEILFGIVADGILDSLKPESCDQKIISEARHRIFSSEAKISPYANMPTDFHPDNSLLKRVYCIFKTIFIPPENLATLYKLPIHSKRVYFYYPIRLMSFIYEKVPQYTPLFVSLLFRKKKDVVQNDFDLWLASKESGN